MPIMTKAEYLYACKNQLLVPYESQLIDFLRQIFYKGIPASIIALSFPVHNRQCYSTAIILSKGMKNFRLILGNTNEYPIDRKYPNHSWVESNHYVYDPIDGFKWDIDLYYKFHSPEVIFEYDDSSILNYDDYHKIDSLLCYDKYNVSMEFLALMLQYIEILEIEESTFNHQMLLEEIEKCRQMYQVTERYSDEVMEEFGTYMKTVLYR